VVLLLDLHLQEVFLQVASFKQLLSTKCAWREPQVQLVTIILQLRQYKLEQQLQLLQEPLRRLLQI
jgi:hypothetical protein